MKCGLLGRKLGHSYSPQIHAMLASYPYSLFEKEPEELESFLKYGDFTGINVTVPYKKAVIPYLDELSPIAARLGAVNTIVRRDGKLIGHNTDYFGFQTMVRQTGLDLSGRKVLVLGSGGASATAVAVLEAIGARVIVISRSGEHNYQNLQNHRDAYAIVNTTPVGMFPNNGESPVDLADFPQIQGVLDVIYNPACTRLLLDAQARGIPAVNGLMMLVAQAKESAQWFTGNAISDEQIPRIYRTLNRQMRNIILIGMPGSGKSTIGAQLAKKLGRQFIDADQEIVRLAGKSIPDIFAQDGQAHFRALETRVLQELGKASGLVIATGGGCVTRPENGPLLRQNGVLIHIRRPLDALATDGRPLSNGADLAQMAAQRMPLYRAFSHAVIDNDGTISDAIEKILTILEEIP